MKYKTLKDLPGIKAGTVFEYNKDTITGQYGVTLVEGDNIGGLLEFIEGFGLDNDFFEEAKGDKKWIPDGEDEYYFIEATGKSVSSSLVRGIELGNYFKTKEEAETYREYLRCVEACKRYLWENDMVCSREEINDVRSYKYYISIDNNTTTLFISFFYETMVHSPYGYIKTEKQARQFIKDMDKELRVVHSYYHY